MKFLAVCLMVFGAECIVGGMGRMVFPFGAKRQIDCAPEQLQQCVAQVPDLANPFSGSKLEDLSDPLVLDRTCTLMCDAQTCVSNYVNDCDPAAASYFQTIQRAGGYICRPEGRYAHTPERIFLFMITVILTESTCLNNPEFENSIQPCNDQMEIDWERVQPDTDTNSVCEIIDDFSECVGDKVRARCSKKAATFVKGDLFIDASRRK